MLHHIGSMIFLIFFVLRFWHWTELKWLSKKIHYYTSKYIFLNFDQYQHNLPPIIQHNFTSNCKNKSSDEFCWWISFSSNLKIFKFESFWATEPKTRQLKWHYCLRSVRDNEEKTVHFNINSPRCVTFYWDSAASIGWPHLNSWT